MQPIRSRSRGADIFGILARVDGDCCVLFARVDGDCDGDCADLCQFVSVGFCYVRALEKLPSAPMLEDPAKKLLKYCEFLEQLSVLLSRIADKKLS